MQLTILYSLDRTLPLLSYITLLTTAHYDCSNIRLDLKLSFPLMFAYQTRFNIIVAQLPTQDMVYEEIVNARQAVNNATSLAFCSTKVRPSLKPMCTALSAEDEIRRSQSVHLSRC